MSRLDELIEKLCPDGAEFLTLQECTKKVKNIKWKSYSGNDKKYIDLSSVDRDLHCIMETQNINSDAAPSRAQQIVQTDDILLGTTRPMLKRYCMIPEKYDDEVCSTGFCVLRANTEIVLPRWIYHNIATTDFFAYVEQNQKGASYPAISDASVKAFSLPVPPLEVQREIVHILDSFTLLTAELTAELTARKKQYEFYRNKLLTFHNNVKIVPLADIADIGTGSSNTNEGIEEGKYPFYVRSQEPLRKNEYEYDETAIITAGDGVGVGKVFHYVEGKYALHQRAYRIHINTPDVLPRYYFHYMRSAFLPYIQKTMFQGSVASIRRPMLNQFPVPVPALDVQKRLVNVLDNFESICTDLNIGLPAEIEARQKQYEYYRDLLLTFAETGSTLMTDRQTDRQTELSAIKLIQYVFGYAYLTLDKISENCDRQRKPVTKGKREAGEYPYYGASGIVDYVSDYIFDGDYLLVSEDGANLLARTTPIAFSISGKNWVNNHAHVLKFDTYELRRYVEIYLNSIDLSKFISGGAQPKLNQENLNKIGIPIPKEEKVKDIINILDRFDTLCNDLSTGLPAEIEARQKQYEYYRDKLLSFKELPK